MPAQWHCLRVAAVLASLVTCSPPARSDEISVWNTRAEAIAAEKRLLPPPNARGMAMLHVAMFEAVNAIDRRYAPYKLKLTADRNASKDAAAAAAAHDVLVALHPDQAAIIDSALAASLAKIADGEAKTRGIDIGRRAATEIVALRASDGSNAPESYRPFTSPGVYVPTVIPVSSTYGKAAPWVMASGSQFRPAPPPALDSAKWTNDLNEIREIGGLHSTKRTPEQTAIGRFWFVTGPQSWNPIVRQLAAMKKLDIVDSARLFALIAIATDDTFIAVFDAKYHFNFWRPITAVRNADLTGNKATPRDASWLPLGDTPMHPEYPCAHCITSAAVGNILQSAFGNDIPQVSMTSPTAPGVTRTWTRITDYTEEVAAARTYAGFHYRFSNAAGQEMGRHIAQLALSTQLRGGEGREGR